MKTIKKILFCLLFSVVFLNSCNQKKYGSNDPNNPFHFSPTEQILKMHPVKITIANWIEYEKHVDLEIKTEEEARAAFNNSENWIVELEITDTNQINMIMTALGKPPIEKAISMPPGETKICFEDEKGNFKSTIFVPLPDLNELYFSDRVYGEETYDVFAKILNIKLIQETKQPEQKHSE